MLQGRRLRRRQSEPTKVGIDDVLPVDILANDIFQRERPPLQFIDAQLEESHVMILDAIVDTKLIPEVLFKAHSRSPFTRAPLPLVFSY